MKGRKPSLANVGNGPRLDIAPPKDLSPAEKKEWRKLLASCGGGVTPKDVPLLRRHCQLAALFEAALCDIKQNGQILTSPSGLKKRNPAVGILSELSRQLAQSLCELGCSPTSRARLGHQDTEPQTSQDIEDDAVIFGIRPRPGRPQESTG